MIEGHGEISLKKDCGLNLMSGPFSGNNIFYAKYETPDRHQKSEPKVSPESRISNLRTCHYRE